MQTKIPKCNGIMGCNIRYAGQEGLLENLIFEGAHKDPEVEKTSSEFEEELGDRGGSSGIPMDYGLKTRQQSDQVEFYRLCRWPWILLLRTVFPQVSSNTVWF